MAKFRHLVWHATICIVAGFFFVPARGVTPHSSPHLLANPLTAAENEQDIWEFSEGATRIQPATHAQLALTASSLNCPFYCGTTVSYTSWKGNVTTMQEFDGLYVRVLVPQTWFDQATFTDEVRRTFVDGFDVVYEYLYEIVGRRPGATLDTIAIVNPPGCGSSCGSVGGNGVELGDDYGYFVDSGTPTDGLEGYGAVHEMTHNFDSYGSTYKFGSTTLADPNNGPLPDSSHYWTTVLRAIYTYSGNQNDYYYHQYEGWLLSYLKLPAASWQTCVVQSACGGSADGWYAPVGLFFRLEHLYGKAAVARWIAFIKNNQSGTTDQDKLDHFFEAYSAAANRNVNCVFDELNWPISQAVRDWTNLNYPNATPDCSNGPNGKSSILDLSAEFDPPATPYSYSGPGGGDWNPQTVGFPGTVNSTGSSADQSFTFNWSIGQSVLIYLCSPTGGHSGGTQVWYYHPAYASIAGAPSFTPATCNTTTLTPPADAPMAIVVKGGADSGAFSIIAVPAPDPSQPHDWGTLSVLHNATTGEFTMTVNQVNEVNVIPTSGVFSGPQTVRFWAQNYGWVAEIPWSFGTTTYSATWTPPSAPAEGIEFRAQVYANAADGYASNQLLYTEGGDTIFKDGFD